MIKAFHLLIFLTCCLPNDKCLLTVVTTKGTSNHYFLSSIMSLSVFHSCDNQPMGENLKQCLLHSATQFIF